MSPIPLGILAASSALEESNYHFLASTTLTAQAFYATISGLGTYATNYTHLQFRIEGGGTQGFTVNADTVRITLNGDSGANYASHAIVGATNDAVNNPSPALYTVGESAANYMSNLMTSASFGVAGAALLDLMDPFSTSKFKTLKSFTGLGGRSNTGIDMVCIGTGLWRSTASVTSITFENRNFAFGGVGNGWQVGTKFSVYGWRNA